MTQSARRLEDAPGRDDRGAHIFQVERVTAYQLATSKWTIPQATVRADDRRPSIVIGTAAAVGEDEAPGQVEVTVAPVQSGWNLP